MTLKRAEGSGQPPASQDAVAAIRAALEAAGVVFVEENGDGPGVRLKKERSMKIERKDFPGYEGQTVRLGAIKGRLQRDEASVQPTTPRGDAGWVIVDERGKNIPSGRKLKRKPANLLIAENGGGRA